MTLFCLALLVFLFINQLNDGKDFDNYTGELYKPLKLKSMQQTLKLLFITSLVFSVFYGCNSGGSDTLNPTVTDIQPESGPPGTAVTISGNDFSPNPSENSVLFDGTSAPVNSATETEIETEVPGEVETGEAEIEVEVDGNTAAGPSFTVEAEAPGISSIEPDSGTVGTEVTIQGMNFSTSAAENTITFAGTDAPVNGAAEDQLLTEVPQGAQDGPVEVTVNGKTATGPDFDVMTTGSLEVITSTSGENQDNEYELLVDGAAQAIGANETSLIPDLEEGSYQVELTDIAENCGVDGDNLRNVEISVGETTSITYEVACWSVAKNQIAFHSDRDGNSEVYLMNTDGTNVTRLTDNQEFDGYPVISNDGTMIAFLSTRNSANGDLFIMNSDGSNIRQLADYPLDKNLINPTLSWSSDNSKIAFTFDNNDLEIFTINIDGSGLSQITDNLSIRDESPSWSPDGNKIAFSSNRDGNDDIYTINIDGTGIQKITESSAYDTEPRWSPDGSKIAFVSDRDAAKEIYTIQSDGSNVQAVIKHYNPPMGHSWSPDGNKIIFSWAGDIYTVNSDGSGSATTLIENGSAPFWSPVE